MKKFTLLSLMLVLVLSFSLSACEPTTQIKNVIILIGDGMGLNHIENTKTYFDIDLFCFESDMLSQVTTHSYDNATTDSAAAASALATGNKVNNRSISRFNGQDLKNIMTIAQENNKKTGIITSDSLYGATPACFSSHANDRRDYDEIIKGQTKSNIDILIGENNNKYLNYKTEFENNGYNFTTSLEELLSYNSNQKIISTMDGLRSKYNTKLQNQKDFNSILSFTLNHLDNEKGFCLMVESAYIDKCSHDNDLYGAICEIRAFADTIETIYNFCKNRKDTVVIITADHETGGLKKATSKTKLTNSLYTSTEHTSANVPFYMFGHPSYKAKETMDNIEIFDICKELIEN